MVAYGASIGGLATLIGTPPNLVTAGMIERLAGVRVTFADWLVFGLPISATLLVVALLLMRFTLARGLEPAARARSGGRRRRPRRAPASDESGASGAPARGGRCSLCCSRSCSGRPRP